MKSTIVLLLLSSLLVSGLALAKEMPGDWQAMPMGPSSSIPASRQDCQVGNYGIETYYIWSDGDEPGNWLWGDEIYMLMFDSEDICPTCDQGFTVEMVYMMIYFQDIDVPAEFTVSGGISETVLNGTDWWPGAPIATSDPVTFSVTEPGQFLLEIPINTPCLQKGYHYGLTVEFPMPFPEEMRPDYMFDIESYDLFTSWGIWPGQPEWIQYSQLDGVGNVAIWADAICCEAPVTVEKSTFGRIKSLYR